ncbi:glycosyltransferase, partial [Acinetobacter baumannii]|nr:glycosyltransferase [Acinetobacter baumannii]
LVQSAGLEWVHRLLQNPRRLARRYLIDCPPVLVSMGRASRRTG